jgi:hypothetical protein
VSITCPYVELVPNFFLNKKIETKKTKQHKSKKTNNKQQQKITYPLSNSRHC